MPRFQAIPYHTDMHSFLAPHEYTIKRLRELQPREQIIYFTGFLEEERLRNPHGSASIIAKAAYALMEQGLIHLTQKRISLPINRVGIVSWTQGKGSGFNYIATGAIPKRRHLEWL